MSLFDDDKINDKINSLPENNKIYEWIYNNVVEPCVIAIQKRDYEFAYKRYKNTVLVLEKQFINKEYNNKKHKVIKKIKI